MNPKPNILRLVVAALVLAFSLQLRADDAPNPVFVHRAQAAFQDAKALLESHPDDTNALVAVARTAFDWADIQTSDSPRKTIANTGISAAQHLLAADPDSVPGHYYLGMDMGELAETETLGALKLVRQMESEFTLVLHTNAAFDYAGADRNLGLLYRDAPGWPASIGNRAKAREHLEKAYKISPNYPENLMNLIESELKWDQPTPAQSHLQTLDQLWPKARREFTGQQWEPAWADWSRRRDDARKKLSAIPATTRAVSPHDQP